MLLVLTYLKYRVMQIAPFNAFVAPKKRVVGYPASGVNTSPAQSSPLFGSATAVLMAGTAALALTTPAWVAPMFRQKKQKELTKNVPLFVKAAFLANGVRFQECLESGVPVEEVSVVQDRKGNLAIQTEHYLIGLNEQYVKAPTEERQLISPHSINLRWMDGQNIELIGSQGALLRISIPAFPSSELFAFLKEIFKRYQFEKSLLPRETKGLDVLNA